MNLNIGKEVAAMKRMTVNELRAKYADLRTTAPRAPKPAPAAAGRTKATTLRMSPDARLPMPGQRPTGSSQGLARPQNPVRLDRVSTEAISRYRGRGKV